jgi:hypothetical protein
LGDRVLEIACRRRQILGEMRSAIQRADEEASLLWQGG